MTNSFHQEKEKTYREIGHLLKLSKRVPWLILYGDTMMKTELNQFLRKVGHENLTTKTNALF